MNRSSNVRSNSVVSIQRPLRRLNINTMEQHRHVRRSKCSRSSSTTVSVIDSHLASLHGQLANLDKQYSSSSSIDSTRLKSLLDAYHYDCLQLKARYQIEQERIKRRFDAETQCTQTQFTARKSELKELLLDRCRRKRKLVVDEMRSTIDIHSRSFDADPVLTTMQTPHPLQAKAYNFRQRPDMNQQATSSYYMNDDDISAILTMNTIGTNGILSPMPQQSTARKRLVGAFSLFQLPRWTIKDDECEDDLRSIGYNRK
jgi:hypothetical protein